MLQLSRRYVIEVCWFLLLLVLMLTTPRRVSSQPDLNCNLLDEDLFCDVPGGNCYCEQEGKRLE